MLTSLRYNEGIGNSVVFLTGNPNLKKYCMFGVAPESI